jgi:hypothetical protein
LGHARRRGSLRSIDKFGQTLAETPRPYRALGTSKRWRAVLAHATKVAPTAMG